MIIDDIVVLCLQWLEMYGLESLRLYNKKMFTSSKTGFKHVTADVSSSIAL